MRNRKIKILSFLIMIMMVCMSFVSVVLAETDSEGMSIDAEESDSVDVDGLMLSKPYCGTKYTVYLEYTNGEEKQFVKWLNRKQKVSDTNNIKGYDIDGKDFDNDGKGNSLPGGVITITSGEIVEFLEKCESIIPCKDRIYW